MDPFSIAIGVTGLLSAVATTVNVLGKFVRSARGSTKEASKMMEALETLDRILNRLRHHPEQYNAAENPIVGNTVVSCRQRIEAIFSKLDKAANSNGLLVALNWPFSKKDHEDALRDIQMFTDWLRLALAIDTNALLRKTTDGLDRIAHKQETLGDVMNEVHQNVTSLKTNKEQNDKNAVLNRLSALDFSQAHTRVSSNRLDGTCRWFLSDRTFLEWRGRTGDSNILLASGLPGSGKTVLSSIVIDHLTKNMDAGEGLAYVYIDHAQAELYDVLSILSDVVKQLCQQLHRLPQTLMELLEKCSDEKPKPKLEAIIESFDELRCQFSTLYLVIDAMDEYNPNQRQSLLRALSIGRQHSTVRAFVTARSHLFKSLTAGRPWLTMEVKAQPSDIHFYVKKEIKENELVSNMEMKLQDRIAEKLAKVANGMDRFLLPVLQLRQILQEPTVGEMQDTLDRLPANLNESFEVTLRRIESLPEGRRLIGLKTLRWLSEAKRPLEIREIQEAFAIRLNKTKVERTYQPEWKTIQECCLGLVIQDEDTATVRFIHYAAQEYFQLKMSDVLFRHVPDLGTLCLSYLALDDFAHGPLRTEAEIVKMAAVHQFYRYACIQWREYLPPSLETHMSPELTRLLSSRSHSLLMLQCRKFFQNFRKFYWSYAEVCSTTYLHFACSFGLVSIFKDLIESGEDINATTSVCKHKPLHHAASRDNTELLRLVLQAKPDIYSSNWYGTALHCAAEAGLIENVRILLREALNVDHVEPGGGRTALHCAVEEEHWELVQFLQCYGADPNAQDTDGQTTLHYICGVDGQGENEALSYRQCQMILSFHTSKHKTSPTLIQTLEDLDRWVVLGHADVDLNIQDDSGDTPLHLAIKRGDEKLVSMLAKLGAATDIKNQDGVTAQELCQQPNTSKELRKAIQMSHGRYAPRNRAKPQSEGV